MFAIIHTLCQLPLGGLEWRSIHSSSIDRESAAVVEWLLYQRSTEDDSQKTEPSLKDLIISVQTHLPPLGFRSWTSSRCWQLVKSETCEKLHIVCIESYLYVFLFVFEENQVVDEIIVILEVKSRGYQGTSPVSSIHQDRKDAWGFGPWSGAFDGISAPRSFSIWWMPICPKWREVMPCGADEEQTRVTRGISFWSLCHPFPSSHAQSQLFWTPHVCGQLPTWYLHVNVWKESQI